MTTRHAMALLLAAMLAGCFTGRTKRELPPSAEKAAQIQVGTTTAAEVLTQLGAPSQIIKLWKSEAYVYDHSVTKSSGLFLLLIITSRRDTQHDRVTVVFDEQGVVKGVGSRFESEEAAFGSPWSE